MKHQIVHDAMKLHTVLMGKNASQLTSALKEHLVSQRPHANNVRVDMEHQTACNAQETSTVTVQQSAKNTQSASKL